METIQITFNQALADNTPSIDPVFEQLRIAVFDLQERHPHLGVVIRDNGREEVFPAN